jgi:hypothetical protein
MSGLWTSNKILFFGSRVRVRVRVSFEKGLGLGLGLRLGLVLKNGLKHS